MKKIQLYIENIKISLSSIRSNLLRTTLTIFIIAFGIMALVGILTAIDSIKNTISNQFTSMGANTFSIVNRDTRVNLDGKSSPKKYGIIGYRDAMAFKDTYSFPAKISISIHASGTATIKYKSEKTNPNIPVLGADENFLFTSGKSIKKGRNFSRNEIEFNSHVAIIGTSLKNELFEDGIDAIGKIISIGSGKYKIIGILEEKGSSFNSSEDKMCILPITNVRQYYSRPNMNYSIDGIPSDPKLLKSAVSEAEGIFRIIRELKATEENNFSIETSDNLATMLIKNIKYVTIATTIIGIITLLGAAIGLMNIMLVSVTERTKEIGIRKAIGANASTIRLQFLFESVIIGQLGGLLGIIFGIFLGNIVSLITKSPFFIPWIWIFAGFALCFFVGLASGILPAIKASKLDPIISLRYE
ncbi:MAG: ABC transporter permease [Bacteroidota bacterium]|nr:ABC transporter permease [Bacteroidota bacterium]